MLPMLTILYILWTHCCHKWVCQTLSLIFVFFIKKFLLILLFFFTCKHIFGVGMLHSCGCMFYGKEGGIQVLAGLALYSQTAWSLAGTPGWPESIDKNWVWLVLFNWKMHSTTLDRTHSVKSKIQQTFLLPPQIGASIFVLLWPRLQG